MPVLFCNYNSFMDQKKQLAFLCHPYHRGGVTRWMVDAAVHAAQAGHAVYFVTVEPVAEFHNSGGRESIVALLQPHRSNITILTERVGYEFEFGTDEYRAAIYNRIITGALPAGVPIIVSDDRAVWAGAATVANRNPMIGVLHCDDPYYYQIGQQYRAQMAACVCVSERVKRLFLQHCPEMQASHTFTIPCGINLPSFTVAPRAEGEARLVFIGRFNDQQKRAQDLVKIAAALHAEGFPFHLDIAGNDEASKIEYTAYFNECGAGNEVTFNGWQNAGEVNSLLRRSDVLVLTSNFEGTPLVMMEALAAGCGFAGTRVSGIEDYEHHQYAPDCFASYDVGDIATAVEKIKLVAAIPAARRQAAARKIAEAEFSMQVCMDKYYKVLEGATVADITALPLGIGAMGIVRSRLMALARNVKLSLKK